MNSPSVDYNLAKNVSHTTLTCIAKVRGAGGGGGGIGVFGSGLSSHPSRISAVRRSVLDSISHNL